MKKYLIKNVQHGTSKEFTVSYTRKCIILSFIVLGTILVITFSFIDCNQDIIPSQTSIVTGTSSSPGTFHSDKYHIEVQLPEGWVAAEGPQAIIVPHLEGRVAFNSWGQTNFWAQAIQEKNPDGSLRSSHFGPGEVTSQVPEGGAYVALLSTFSPPITLPEQNTPTDIPDEYTLNDLSGLYKPHDWRQDSATYAYFKTFYKHGSWLELVVACSQNATDNTVAELNSLLQSWKFVVENP